MKSNPAAPPAVLVAHSYFLRHDPKQMRRMKPYPPLATLIAAGVLRDRGYPVEVFDAMLSDDVADFSAHLDRLRPRIVAILEDNFNFLTKMCTLRMREATCEMIMLARAAGCRVMVNGSDATDNAGRYLEIGADAVIVGAVEPCVAELCDLWAADADASPDGISGLALTAPATTAAGATHAVRYTPPRPALRDLDALPLPAWDLIDADRYRRAWTNAHGRFSWNVVASRGCPYGCNWCAKPVFGRRYAQRSPHAVAGEMRRLLDHIAPDHVWFADDIFGLTHRWIRDFADAVQHLDARIPFMIQSRANLMTPATVAALRDAGAEEVWLGVESGSQRILDDMDKGTTIEQIRDATHNLKDVGVRVGWFIQLGYLGEEWEDLLLTRDLIRACRPDEIGVSVAYPLPGTGFHAKVRAHLGSKRNWDHTGDLDMLFHGTYTTDFYRTVRDLLHAEVDAWRNGGGEFDGAWTELEAREAEFRNAALAR